MLSVPSILITFCQHEMERNATDAMPKKRISRCRHGLSHLTNVRGNKLN